MKDFSFEHGKTVCFFDSGIGGLTLLGECVKRISDAGFIYFADNGNVPYGNLPKEKIISLADKIFSEIQKCNPSAAVIACNTVTAQCAAFLRRKYSFPIIGIQPAVKTAAKTAESCVVLATPATADSASVKELVAHFGNGVTRIVPCPDLAAYIERNIFDLDKKEIFRLLPDVKADSIVLGCTHYIYIEQAVKEKYNCPVYDGIEGTANRLCSVLGNAVCFEEGKDKKIPSDRKSRGGFASEVSFCGGDERKNESIFNGLIMETSKIWGNFSH